MKLIRGFRGSPFWLWLIPLMLLVTWLGARGLDADSIWADEWWSLYNAGGAYYGPLSPGEIWDRILTEDPWQTPLYYLMLAGWGAVVGWTEFATRAMSLLAGVLSVAMIYRLGRDLTREPLVGLGAAVALGTGAFYVNYLHDLRVYTLYSLLTIIFLWSYWRLVTRPVTIWRQVVFFLSIIALMYSHYFAALVIVTVGLYHLIFIPKTREWWRVVILMVLGGICFLPWLNAIREAITMAQTIRRANVAVPALISDVLTMFSNANIPLLALLFLSVMHIRKRVVAAIWFWAVVYFVLAALAMQRLSLNEVRYAMGLWIPLTLLVGLGVRYSGIKQALAIGIWLLAGVFHVFDPAFQNQVHSTFWHQPIRELRDALSGHTREGDLVTFHLWTDYGTWSQFGPVTYYLMSIPVDVRVFEDLTASNFDLYIAQGRSVIAENPDRVWVTYVNNLVPQRLELFEQMLRDNDYHYCSQITNEPEIGVELYIRIPETSAIEPIAFDAGITLTLALPLEVTTNTGLHTLVLPAVLEWMLSPETPLETYSVGLHIDNADGQLVQQLDYGLTHGCHADDLSLAGLPSGDYRLYLVVYNWQTGERLNAVNEDGNTVDRLLLATFTLP